MPSPTRSSTYLHTPQISTVRGANTRALFYSLVLLHNTEVRGFRTLFGKPANGQRTSCNAQTAKRNKSALYDFKYSQLRAAAGPTLTQPIFTAEYVNLFWQHQWVFEWVPSYKALRYLPFYLRRTNFIDIPNMNRFHIYHQYQNPFKRNVRVKQRRKKVVPKNKFPTGFPFGFSITYKKQLQTIS